MRFPATRFLPILLLLGACVSAPDGPGAERAQWERQAERVTITRDDWGIAHIRGRSDADAVFGMIYAQAEDDFNRIETNYLVSLGRLAEAEGEKAIWQDLRARLYMDGDDLRARYEASPDWLKRLMEAWADGLNYYLATHPEVRPRAISRFEPWMTLSFSEGSIGGDIERIDLAALEAFYSKRGKALAAAARLGGGRNEPGGSNGFAIAPQNTAEGRALLLINPHTSFYFRSEQQMTSEEGLNAYGAATWGQFFIYQGFNQTAGWMHTSSGVDAVDEFIETIEQRGEALVYRYGKERRPVEARTVTIAYRAPDGSIASRTFETYRTHHGPIVREDRGKWIAFAMMHKPVEALQQSYLRTKAKNYAEFLRISELKANSSNNTIFADAEGNIAYLHPQFIPRRDDRFDYSKPVDGSDPRTDWRGLHALDEAPALINPPNGWIQNTNNWPYSAAGSFSPKREAFPRYMDGAGENQRGLHAQAVLGARRDFTLDRLRDAAYDSHLPLFERLVPGLVHAWEGLPREDRLKSAIAPQIELLRAWDYRSAVDSVATTLAGYWADELSEMVPELGQEAGIAFADHIADRLPPRRKLEALAAASAKIESRFGSWRTPWGETNRIQRVSGDIRQHFDDGKPSLAVPFASGHWGSLAVFGGPQPSHTKRYYGVRGNSFVAVVEFGERVRARALSTGGQSGDPKSPHFDDQLPRYPEGDLREVYFYPDQLRRHTKRVYRPGARQECHVAD